MSARHGGVCLGSASFFVLGDAFFIRLAAVWVFYHPDSGDPTC